MCARMARVVAALGPTDKVKRWMQEGGVGRKEVWVGMRCACSKSVVGSFENIIGRCVPLSLIDPALEFTIKGLMNAMILINNSSY